MSTGGLSTPLGDLTPKQRQSMLALLQEAKAAKGMVAAEFSMSFREFVQKVKPDFIFHRHSEQIIETLQKVADGEIQRLMIWIPPRSGKSLLASELFPAYMLLRYPKRNVGLVSYSESLSQGFSRKVQDAFLRGGGTVNPSVTAKEWWASAQGAEVWATAPGGSALGKGYSLGIIDDPHKPSEMTSVARQDTLRDFWDSTWHERRNRITGDAWQQIIIMQRLADDDLCGWLLSRPDADTWTVLALDSIKSSESFNTPPGVTVITDDRAEGEMLCEALMTRSDAEAQKANNVFVFNSVQQQRPGKGQGTLCSRDDFAPCRYEKGKHPAFSITYRAWDVALTSKKKSDWSVGIRFGVDEQGDVWILDVIREQLEGPDVENLIRSTAALDPLGIITAIEQAVAQLTIVQNLMRDPIFAARSFVPVVVHGRSGDLRARSAAVFSKIKNRKFHVPHGEEGECFINECLRFTGKATDVDDQISAMSVGMQAFVDYGTSVVQEEEPLNPWSAEFRIKQAEERLRMSQANRQMNTPILANPF